MGRTIIGYEHAGALHWLDADSVPQWRALTGVTVGLMGVRDLADFTPAPELLYHTQHGYAMITREQFDGGGLAVVLTDTNHRQSLSRAQPRAQLRVRESPRLPPGNEKPRGLWGELRPNRPATGPF